MRGRDKRTRFWDIKFFNQQTEIELSANSSIAAQGVIRDGAGRFVILHDFKSVMNALASTLYIGPFRNVINVGANQDYFDISVGDAFINQFQILKAGASMQGVPIIRGIDGERT